MARMVRGKRGVACRHCFLGVMKMFWGSLWWWFHNWISQYVNYISLVIKKRKNILGEREESWGKGKVGKTRPRSWILDYYFLRVSSSLRETWLTMPSHWHVIGLHDLNDQYFHFLQMRKRSLRDIAQGHGTSQWWGTVPHLPNFWVIHNTSVYCLSHNLPVFSS